jgi:hypothetical protein
MNNGRRPFPNPRLPSQLVRSLSPKRRELVRPILDQPRDYVLLSARKLAHAVGSDAMTVLRAIRAMGFEGYAEFRRYLHELALVQATQLDPIQPARARDSNVPAHLQDSLAHDSDNVTALRRTIEVARIEALALRLYQARRIVLLGGDLASVLATFLQYNLAVIDLPAVACTRPGEVVRGPRAAERRPRDRHHLPSRPATDGRRGSSGPRQGGVLCRAHRYASVAAGACCAGVFRHTSREHTVRSVVRGADGVPQHAARCVCNDA